MTKIGTAASASGDTSAATTPVSEKSSGPASSSAHQPRSALALVGTSSSQQTIESSLSERVADQKWPPRTQPGSSESGSRRTTAYSSSSVLSFTKAGRYRGKGRVRAHDDPRVARSPPYDPRPAGSGDTRRGGVARVGARVRRRLGRRARLVVGARPRPRRRAAGRDRGAHRL